MNVPRPYERFTLNSPLEPEDAMLRLTHETDAKTVFGRPRDAKVFVGELDGREFRVSRAAVWRNPFRPLIHGWVVERPGGSQVAVLLRPLSVLVVFGVLWFGTLTLGLAVSIVVAVLQGWPGLLALPLVVLAILGMAGLGYFMMLAMFRWEAPTTLETLESLLEAGHTASQQRWSERAEP